MKNVHIPWLLTPRLPNAHALRVRPTAGSMMFTSGPFKECRIDAMLPQGGGGNAFLSGKGDPLGHTAEATFSDRAPCLACMPACTVLIEVFVLCTT